MYEYLMTEGISLSTFLISISALIIMFILGISLEIKTALRFVISITVAIATIFFCTYEDMIEFEKENKLKQIAIEVTGDKNAEFDLVKQEENKFSIIIDNKVYQVTIEKEKTIYSLQKDKKVLKDKGGN